MQIERYKNNKDSKFLTGFAMNNLLKPLKEEYPWLKYSNAQSLQDTCQNLGETFKRFFKHTSKHPRFKSRKYSKQSFKIKQDAQVISSHYLKLRKLGYIKYRGYCTDKKVKSATIKLSPTGKFYYVLLVECESQAPMEKTNKNVGLDMGVADLVITSDGIKYPTINFDKKLGKKKRVWERKLARRRAQAKNIIATEKHMKLLNPRTELTDFKNYVKAKQMVAKYSEKVANQRKDYLQKITTELVKQYDTIVIEDLKTNNLLKNHHLARAIANQSWRELRTMLEYKCDWYGKELKVVNPYKTSQVCSNCGYDDGKHTLDIRQWTCPQCHSILDRDINASKNIMKLGLG